MPECDQAHKWSRGGHPLTRDVVQYLYIQTNITQLLTSKSMDELKQKPIILILVVLTMFACTPIFLTPHIPLADYPNHLARVQVWNEYLHGFEVPHLEPVLALQPNMAFDLVVLGLTQITDIETAGKIFILLTITSIIWGPAILSRKLNSDLSVLNFLPFLLVYNRLFFWGFLGYLFSLGVAIGASSLWINSEKDDPNFGTFLARSTASTIVMTGHLYAFGVLSILATFLTALDFFRNRKLSPKKFFYATLPLAIPLPLFAIASPAFNSIRTIEWGSLTNKFIAFAGIFIGQTPSIDITAGLAAALFIAWATLTKRLAIQNWGLVLVVGMIGLHLMMPDKLLSSYGADKRLPIAIALISTALIRPTPTQQRIQLAITLGLVISVSVGRLYFINENWKIFNPIYMEHEQAFKHIPRNASIVSIVGTTNPDGLPKIPLTELAGYAVIERNVFWPGIFAYPIHGAQTIQFKSLDPQQYVPSAVQKIPLNNIAEILIGRITYNKYDLREIPPCYEYMTVSLEHPLDGHFPQTSVFGEKIYATTHVAVYKNKAPAKCL